jgi:hypothetical protein
MGIGGVRTRRVAVFREILMSYCAFGTWLRHRVGCDTTGKVGAVGVVARLFRANGTVVMLRLTTLVVVWEKPAAR